MTTRTKAQRIARAAAAEGRATPRPRTRPPADPSAVALAEALRGVSDGALACALMLRDPDADRRARAWAELERLDPALVGVLEAGAVPAAPVDASTATVA